MLLWRILYCYDAKLSLILFLQSTLRSGIRKDCRSLEEKDKVLGKGASAQKKVQLPRWSREKMLGKRETWKWETEKSFDRIKKRVCGLLEGKLEAT